MIEANLIHQAYRHDVKKLLFLGSSCIYPKLCPQPMREDYLLEGKLEPTNEPYAVAKIAGVEMCRAYNRQYGTCFIAVMPTNLYGPGDNFDLLDSHVIPALIRKFHQAKAAGDPEVVVWGTGAPMREFLYVDDLADACLFLMERYQEGEIINIGVGQDLQIVELARAVAAVIGFKGQIKLDPTYPDGTPRKLLDVSRLTALWGGRPGRLSLRACKRPMTGFLPQPLGSEILTRRPFPGRPPSAPLRPIPGRIAFLRIPRRTHPLPRPSMSRGSGKDRRAELANVSEPQRPAGPATILYTP